MKSYNCDSCQKPIVGEPTVVYARQEGPSKKAELCAICVQTRLQNINWQAVKPRIWQNQPRFEQFSQKVPGGSFAQ